MSEISDYIQTLQPEQLKELKEALGIRKARPKKEESPELIAARAELEAFEATNKGVIDEFKRLTEAVRGFKGTRVVLATVKYNLDPANGAITGPDGSVIATFGTEGWQSAMRASGYTNGQVAAVSKKMRAATA